MKYSNSFYGIKLLVILMTLLVYSCKKEEMTPFLELADNDTDKVWIANALGDTLIVDFSTNVSLERITINNVQEWMTYDLQPQRLLLYVRANSGTSVRSGNVGILTLNKGNLTTSKTLKITQDPLTSLAEDKFLFTYYPKMRYRIDQYHNENKELTMLLPATGGTTEYDRIFYTNINKDNLVVEFEYSENTPDNWIKSWTFVETEKGINGIRVEVRKLPTNIAQRSVKITLHDKEFKNISASIKCMQIRQTVKIADKKDLVTQIPIQPTLYSVLLDTDIPIEKLKADFYQVRYKTDYGKEDDEKFHIAFKDQLLDPIFQYNYIKTATQKTPWKSHVKFKQTAKGVVLEGLISTQSSFFGKREGFGEIYKTLVLISNEINDNVLGLVIEEKNSKGIYLFFEDNKKEITLNLSQTVNTYNPSIRTNVENVYIAGPSWSSWEKSRWGGSSALDVTHPDMATMKNNGLLIYPNTLRTERKGLFVIQYNPLSASGPPQATYEAAPLRIKVVQEAFTGSYMFNLKTTVDTPILFNNDESNKPLALETNLDKSQIRITKSALGGWIDYELNVDNKTGYVIGILFSADKNDTGEDRSVTYSLEGPENEGLNKITLNFKQSK